MVYVYNVILLSNKIEENCAICRDVDGPRDCHTKWSKSEREKQMYIHTYMWNLGKWYRWTNLQSRNRDTDIKNVQIPRGEKGGMDWEIRTAVHILLCIK